MSLYCFQVVLINVIDFLINLFRTHPPFRQFGVILTPNLKNQGLFFRIRTSMMNFWPDLMIKTVESIGRHRNMVTVTFLGPKRASENADKTQICKIMGSF